MEEIKSYDVLIEPARRWEIISIREVWRFRELIYFLAWRDVKVKYKQTALGITWVILQPVLAMIIFSFIFGRYGSIPSDGIPYPVFVFIGLLPWNYFASVLGQSTTSLVTGTNLISKIYFPRIIIPLSSVIVAFLDLFVRFAVLIVILIYYGFGFNIQMVILPLLLIILAINSIGSGLWFSALNVRYRDVQHAIPFLIQIWMFITPVIYPISFLGKYYKLFFILNPLSGIIEAFRPALLGHQPIPWVTLSISTAAGFIVFIGGVLYFGKVEQYFADVI